jgi:predicted RNase H-like HicB family nuclease
MVRPVGCICGLGRFTAPMLTVSFRALPGGRVRTYTAVVERDPDTGMYVGYIPGWPGAHTQGESLDELQANLREVVELLLADGEPKLETEFVGTQTVVLS